MNDGVLVSREWLERVNDAVFGNETGKPIRRGDANLFYVVRPAVLASAWTLTDGVYRATAKLIAPTGAASTYAFPVYAPTATANPGGTVDSTRFSVVWRGRWELIGGGSGETTGAQILAKLNVSSASTVTNVSTQTETVAIPTSGSVTTSSVGSVTLSLSDSSSTGAVAVVTDIAAVAGAIGVETKYLSATATTTQQTATVNFTTSNKTIIKSVTPTTANRVASITAKN